jgi:hypothetical protein
VLQIGKEKDLSAYIRIQEKWIASCTVGYDEDFELIDCLEHTAYYMHHLL